eukprot:8423637-Karenia_brevis.AAC.1
MFGGVSRVDHTDNKLGQANPAELWHAGPGALKQNIGKDWILEQCVIDAVNQKGWANYKREVFRTRRSARTLNRWLFGQMGSAMGGVDDEANFQSI